MKKFNALDWISYVLLVVGGLNWGLVGLFNFDLVAAIFGDMSLISKIVYILVGLAAVYFLVASKKVTGCESVKSPEGPTADKGMGNM